ncbi:MAG: FAD-binding oxidoreductase [Anaerolineales bacterium]|jgi:alkyldihydroxyacetonephosphate synthase
MKRWNGWGNPSVDYPLPSVAAETLAMAVGKGRRLTDASLESVLTSVPASRLPHHALISIQAKDRLRHARGQSLPDWIALRSGRVAAFPDGVAYPADEEQLQELIHLADHQRLQFIPYGGGTSVVGHINPLPSDRPVLTVDLREFNQLLKMDESSHLATFQAGVTGPALEAALAQQGYTLGHFPQSWEYSTLGGWIATRSSGQQSYYYGRIEDLFAGGEMLSPAGRLSLPPFPASAAGPDLRQWVLGSEGRLGVITRAQIRIRKLPEVEGFYGAFFPDWESGVKAVRSLAQSDIPLSLLRLSDPDETMTTLALSGKDQLVTWADRGLRLLRYGDQRSLLIYGFTGSRRLVGLARRRAGGVIRSNGGLPVGSMIGGLWRKSRFHAPYLRNTLWEEGYALDTLETALPWSKVKAAAVDIKAALRDGLMDHGERVLVFAHLSHVYNDGASLYVTYLYRRSVDPDQTLDHWRRLKAAASCCIVEQGGTISHQHGVGLDHAPYLVEEKGVLGIEALRSAGRVFDPGGVMNPGKLLPAEPTGGV